MVHLTRHLISPISRRKDVKDTPDDVQETRGDVGALGELEQLYQAHDDPDQACQPTTPHRKPSRHHRHNVDEGDGEGALPRLSISEPSSGRGRAKYRARVGGPGQAVAREAHILWGEISCTCWWGAGEGDFR